MAMIILVAALALVLGLVIGFVVGFSLITWMMLRKAKSGLALVYDKISGGTVWIRREEEAE